MALPCLSDGLDGGRQYGVDVEVVGLPQAGFQAACHASLLLTWRPRRDAWAMHARGSS